MRSLLRLLAVLVLLLGALAAVAPADAQVTRSWVPGGQPVDGGLDYFMWEQVATAAEDIASDPNSTNQMLEQQRIRILEWRARFQAVQHANHTRIETLRSQINALGPPPEEGASEAPEIANRRQELDAQLARFQAPVVAAEEAALRADGLIREIDEILRERQAEALLQVWPSPVNPVNWPIAWRDIARATSAFGFELSLAFQVILARGELQSRLPQVLAYLVVALLLLTRGRRMLERLTSRVQRHAEGSRGAILTFVVSLGQVVVPFIGVLALTQALRATGMVGLISSSVVDELPRAGLVVLVAIWLGGQVFPRVAASEAMLPVRLPPQRRKEGRFHTAALGLVVATAGLLIAKYERVAIAEATQSVLAFPFIVVGALLLFRIGQLLRGQQGAPEADGQPTAIADRLIAIIGLAAMAVAVAAPLLAALGYGFAARALVIPATVSLGLVAGLVLLQRLIADVYVLLMGGNEEFREALVPTLAGSAIVLLSLPLFALAWGVRPTELWNIWEAIQRGFAIGEARISPTQFLWFAFVFSIGFAVTRLVQASLRTSVLPKTRLDPGAQSALVNMLGYVGLFIAAVIAFTSAGINLANLALVAGALSVGIGFGLQTVVNNFVSGIILLLERPVAEGDWIEVDGVMGTVQRISVRSTVIQTFDRNHVIVPNADLIANQVTNWTRYNLAGRLMLKVSVAYGTDTRKVEKILYEIAEAHPLVVLNPPPNVVFMEFGADGLEFEVRVILRDVNFLIRARSDLNHEIARRFAEEGIEIPFGQTDIWLRNAEEVAKVLRAAVPSASSDAALESPSAESKELPAIRREAS